MTLAPNLALPLVLVLLACTSARSTDSADDDASAAVDARGDCNPVDDGQCLLPFPSDYFMEADGNRGTGLRVAFGPTSLPENIDHAQMSPDFWNELDGFSTLGELLAHLPDASLDGVVGWEDLGAYLDPDVRTVIVDAETGERAPHWVERDVFGSQADRELLVLRPAAPLQHGTRYVVGIRGLVDHSGAPISPPPGFGAIRDGVESADPDLERQRSNYDAIFATLEGQGFARDNLQLAWSFTTTSKQGSLGRALWMRDDAIAWGEGGGWSYTIDQVDDSDCSAGATIGRSITGTVTAPLYLETEDPGGFLTRDADGWPFRNGTAQVPFTARIPCSVINDPRPVPVLQFGHGLLADQDDVKWGSVGEIANDTGSILLAVDWWGMAAMDRAAVTTMIVTQPDRFATIPERLMQAYVNAQVARRTLGGAMGSDDAFMVDGQSVVDPAETWFFGVSMGAVLGGGFSVYSRDVSRVLLTVPGAPFTLLLARSTGFAPFMIILQTMFEDPADVSVIIALMQSLWDPGEAAGYARFMTREPLDELVPDKEVLLVAGLGDELVTALGAHVMARAYGAQLIAPTVRDVYGVEAATPPFSGSAFMEEDWGVEDPVEAVPADGQEIEVHNLVPWTAAAKDLAKHWLLTGEAITTCEGVCDPE